MKSLTVFYDDACALCLRCRDWLKGEPQIVRLALTPNGALAARHPTLAPYAKGSDLVVIDDDGNYWVGDAAFLTILFALERYRSVAKRLASPSLRPYARRFFEAVSSNRAALSSLMGYIGDEAVLKRRLDGLPPAECAANSCTSAVPR
jgi:predicted DCC family thiol-disulfide oxidoreductase YuxK